VIYRYLQLITYIYILHTIVDICNCIANVCKRMEYILKISMPVKLALRITLAIEKLCRKFELFARNISFSRPLRLTDYGALPYLMMQISPTTRSLLGTCLMSPLRTTRDFSCLSRCRWRPRNCRSLDQLMSAVTSTIRTTANIIAALSIAPDVRSVGSATETTSPSQHTTQHRQHRHLYILRESKTTQNVLWSRGLCVCLCVCLSVRGRTPTLLHRPGCNLGAW